MPAHLLPLSQWRTLAGPSLLLLLTGPGARAQAPAWQSAVARGGNTSAVTATAVDADGNAYLAAPCYATVSLGSFSLTTAEATAGFVAR